MRTAGYKPWFRCLLTAILGSLVPAQARGQFSEFPTWSSGPTDRSHSIALGDVDRDGDLDLVCGNEDQSSTLYLNEGGNFSTFPTWSSGRTDRTFSVALGDVDMDGDLDLVCGNYNQSSTLYLNEGGAFSASPAWSSGPTDFTQSVALGDVDKDGDLDLVCGNEGQSSTLYLNEGGNFSTSPTWSSGRTDRTFGVALGDVDKDGDLDLVCGNVGQNSTLYLNEGGTFSTSPAWSSGRTDLTYGVALGDVDGDGDLDLVLGNSGRSSSALYLNEGGAFSTSPAWSSGGADDTRSVALGDVDKDGDLDLVCGNDGERSALYLNEGGVFSASPAWSSGRADDTRSVALGDVDGGGDLDLVCGNFLQWSTLYLNLGGTLSTSPAWSSGRTDRTASVALGDVDKDGDLDLVLGNSGQSSSALYLNEGGAFSAFPAWSTGGEDDTRSVALGDVDKDGDLDLVCGNDGESSTLYLNLGGALSASPAWFSGRTDRTASVALGDVDKDGDLDLVCGNRDESSTLYLNLGGTFSIFPAWYSGRTDDTYSVALGDVDKDGDLDLVCGNFNQSSTLYLNEGGAFSDSPAWYSGHQARTTSAALGDVDGDGDLDLVCGNVAQSSTLYFNEGGAFSVSPVWSSGRADATFGVALGDVDGDGDLDLVCGNDGQSSALYLNEGGAFSISPAWSSGLTDRTSGVALGDVNGDGDLDLVCGNALQSSTLYMNHRAPPFKGDPTSPTHHLPNNSAFLRGVGFAPKGTNTYEIRFQAVDVELDAVWVLADYQYLGDPRWLPLDAGLPARKLGPLASSPEGTWHTFTWEVSRLPLDPREAVLRLRAISNPGRAGLIQHVAAYDAQIGTLDVRGPRIAPAVETLLLPTVTLGDTTGTTLTLVNRGNEDLLIQSYRFPAPGMWIAEPLPVLVRPEESATVTLSFAPGFVESIHGDLAIESNDPQAPVATVVVIAPVRPIEYLVASSPGPVPSDDDFDVIVTMRDSVRVDSVLVSYRQGGLSHFDSVKLARFEDPRNEQHLGVIPDTAITASGIEYFVEVHNGAFQVTEDLRKIRVRTRDLAFPFSQPAGTYRMISVPLEMEGAILGVLGDDLLETEWRMFAYDTAYVELPDERLPSLEQGRSYWLITRNEVRLDTSPERGISAPTDSAFALALRSGWNQIANPFAFPVAWADVQVGGADANNQDVVEPPWEWIPQQGNSGTYSNSVDVLGPFDGYWVKNRSAESVTLSLLPIGASNSIAQRSAWRAEPDPRADTWRLRIVAATTGARDESNFAGVSPGASDAWDRFDRSDPPPAPGSSVSVYFPHSALDRGTEFLASDFRSPATEAPRESPDRFTWRFDVARHDPDDDSPVEIVLEFQGLETLPAGVDALLVDKALGRTQDLREEATYAYLSGNKVYVSHASEARFALLVGDPHIIRDGAEAPPSQTRLLQSYPNPCRTSTVIRYETSDAGPGSIRIVDVQGRHVRTLNFDHGEAGRYEVAWGADDDAGRRVSPGIYFYRLEASGTTHVRRLVVLQ